VQWVPAASGATLCTGAAACLTSLFQASSFKPFLPLLFLGVVVLVAIRFGRLAGILGTAAAALIFAEFLFEPRLSLIVRDSAEKSNLIWMIIGGMFYLILRGIAGQMAVADVSFNSVQAQGYFPCKASHLASNSPEGTLGIAGQTHPAL